MWWGIGTVGVGKRTRLVTEAVVTGAVGAGARAVVCRSELVLGLPLVHVMVLVVVLVLMLVLLSMNDAVVGWC